MNHSVLQKEFANYNPLTGKINLNIFWMKIDEDKRLSLFQLLQYFFYLKEKDNFNILRDLKVNFLQDMKSFFEALTELQAMNVFTIFTRGAYCDYHPELAMSLVDYDYSWVQVVVLTSSILDKNTFLNGLPSFLKDDVSLLSKVTFVIANNFRSIPEDFKASLRDANNVYLQVDEEQAKKHFNTDEHYYGFPRNVIFSKCNSL